MNNLMGEDPGFALETALVAPGRVIAWRRWRLCPDPSGRPRLGSAHEDQIWESGSLRAECDPSRTWSYRLALDPDEAHQSPAAGCRCGIYTYRTAELARPMGPGIWVHGQVVIGGPMFLTDSGYRSREAAIDGPLHLTVECVGGDDLYSPTRCLETPVLVKYGQKAYYPVCSSHRSAPVHVAIMGERNVADVLEAAAVLGVNLGTSIVMPTPMLV
ncbi:MAG: hypothetical protein RI637_11580 [Acidimicrobiia bacterium]|nr:hypothetical protein [Acidimicrobiia bacterium]